MYEGHWYTEHGIEITLLTPIFFASLEPDALLTEVEDALGSCRIGEVGRHHVGLNRVRLRELLGELVQAILAPGHQHHVDAVLGKESGVVSPQSRGSSCD